MDNKQRLEADGNSSVEQKTLQVCCFEKKKCLEVWFEGGPRKFLRGRGKSFYNPFRGAENSKGAGTNSGKSGTRNRKLTMSAYNLQANWHYHIHLPETVLEHTQTYNSYVGAICPYFASYGSPRTGILSTNCEEEWNQKSSGKEGRGGGGGCCVVDFCCIGEEVE